MRVGCLGKVVFTVSEQAIETIDRLEWSSTADYAEHARHLMGGLAEFTGRAADKLSFEIYLSAYLGVNPMQQLEALRKYQSNGKAVSFILGDKSYGKYRWVITSLKAKVQTFDREGNVLGMTVSIGLLEYLRR